MKVADIKKFCDCNGCREKRENEEKHLAHPFYAEVNQYRETIRREQVLKGAAKYPTPFDPTDWTAKELLQHAMQENVDQGHYIYGLFEKIEAMEKALVVAKDELFLVNQELNGWRLKAIKAQKQADDLQNTMYETRDF
jgi:hypothetical protein